MAFQVAERFPMLLLGCRNVEQQLAPLVSFLPLGLGIRVRALLFLTPGPRGPQKLIPGLGDFPVSWCVLPFLLYLSTCLLIYLSFCI